MNYVKCEKHPYCKLVECECHINSLINKRLLELNITSPKLITELNKKVEGNFQKFIDKTFKIKK
jgi:hypothetical protein